VSLFDAAWIEGAGGQHEIAEDAGRHHQPRSVPSVKTSPSAMSPPLLRRPFPGSGGRRTEILPGCPRRFLPQVAVREVLLVCNVQKRQMLPLMRSRISVAETSGSAVRSALTWLGMPALISSRTATAEQI
jgi:hypothetical protein